jgi:tetratricopeptide (TPR) repeat protein
MKRLARIPRWLRWSIGIFMVFLLAMIVIGGSLVAAFKEYQVVQSEQRASQELTDQILATRARQQQASGDYQGAERSLEEAIQKQAKLDYELQLAVVQYRLQKYEQAIARYQKVLEQSNEKAFVFNGIGNAYRDWSGTIPATQPIVKKDYETKAIEAYVRAYAIDPKFVAAYSNLAIFLGDLGDTERAKNVLDEGIAATQNEQLIKRRAQL